VILFAEFVPQWITFSIQFFFGKGSPFQNGTPKPGSIGIYHILVGFPDFS